MVDELEESTPAQRALLEALAADNPNQLFALRGRRHATIRQSPGSATSIPTGEEVVLEHRFREPQLRFWSCANERAQAQAVGARGRAPARRRRRAGGDLRPRSPTRRREGGAVAAAMEERGIPFHLSGPTALFQRPEVRDAIAWLRVLADPDDSARRRGP